MKQLYKELPIYLTWKKLKEFYEQAFFTAVYPQSIKKNSEGLASIYLRVTIDGEWVEISIKRSIEVKKWNKVA